MNLLLDTHVLLWWLANDPRLGEPARAAIADSRRKVYVSSASAWEISIKRALNKLEAPDNLQEALTVNGFTELSISLSHTLAIAALPPQHSDPFDRMLVAQAQLERLMLVTRDPRIFQYEVAVLKA